MWLSLILLAQPFDSGLPALAQGKLHRTVDLDRGEAREVELSDGRKVTVKLLEVEETREKVCNAAWLSRVKVEVGGTEAWLAAGTYNLPVVVGSAQVDCTITRGPYENAATDYWSLEKAARLRLWPPNSPLIEPNTYVYPLRQRWFAGDTWMSNEPVIPNAPKGKLYYHSGLDIGGSEGLIEVVSATDGRVVAAGKEGVPDLDEAWLIPGYRLDRYPKDQVHVMDERGWSHAYVHLKTIDVKAGQKVRKGERLGLLGKEGGSGGWSHLHYEIRSRQPSGKWGTENGYPFLWEAYMSQHVPPVVAVAGPIHHRLAIVGEKVRLDGSLSRGSIRSYEWGTSSGATVEKAYDKPGTYSEVLKVTNTAGEVDYDFAIVGVIDPNAREALPPRLNATYAPTFGLQPGDPVTFKVRTWNTKEGEETWDFGDGKTASTQSQDAYAETVHRYEQPGHYLVRVERTGHLGTRGTAHLQVRVGEKAGRQAEKGLLERLRPPDAKPMMAGFVDRHLDPLPLPATREEWLERRGPLRKRVLEILGLDDLVPSKEPPLIRPKGTILREGYRIEKLTFESWPGMEVPALLYLPETKGRVPGMVSITGHTDISKAADYIQTRNVNLALRGCAVLSYDYYGYGERKTGKHPHHPEGANGHDGRSFSFSRRNATTIEVLDAVKAVDVLADRAEIDPERLGFTGESGGSNSTYWIAAIDERVKLAVPVCSVSTFDYWIRTNVDWDWHQRPPGIRQVADIGTLLALHAPNPLLILSSKRGTDDQEFPLDEAEKSHQWARRVHRLLGAESEIAHVESATAHGYQEDKRRHLYGWVESRLKPASPKGEAELRATIEKREDLDCGLPAGNKTFRDIHAEWLKELPRPTGRPREFLRERLGLPSPLPEVQAERLGELWSFESEPGIRLWGILAGPGDAPIVVIPGRDPGAVSRALEAGRRVFVFEPRGGYSGNTWGDRTSNWAWFAGRPWPGQWALDILQAARFCRGRSSVVLVDASNSFGWSALLAAGAHPEILSRGRVRIPVASLHEIVKEKGDRALADVPGLLEHLDVPELRALSPEVQVEVKP